MDCITITTYIIDTKYREIEEDKCNLGESCENANLAIKQLLDEETELLKHVKQLECKLDHYYGKVQDPNKPPCCCAL